MNYLVLTLWGLLALAYIFDRLTWIRRRVRRRVAVQTDDDVTIEGVLVFAGRDGLVLRAAEYVGPDVKTAISGDVWIPRGKVVVVQVLPS